MRKISNKGVVYTGKVGANMGQKRIRKNTSCVKVPTICKDGPMAGETLYLHRYNGFETTTAVFTLHGETGHYNN